MFFSFSPTISCVPSSVHISLMTFFSNYTTLFPQSLLFSISYYLTSPLIFSLAYHCFILCCFRFYCHLFTLFLTQDIHVSSFSSIYFLHSIAIFLTIPVINVFLILCFSYVPSLLSFLFFSRDKSFCIIVHDGSLLPDCLFFYFFSSQIQFTLPYFFSISTFLIFFAFLFLL